MFEGMTHKEIYDSETYKSFRATDARLFAYAQAGARIHGNQPLDKSYTKLALKHFETLKTFSIEDLVAITTVQFKESEFEAEKGE